MTVPLLGKVLRPLGNRMLRGLIFSELEGQMSSHDLGRYRPNKEAMARLVEEVKFRAGPLTSGSADEGRRVLNEAKWVAEQVAAYRVDHERCDQSIKGILDFHGGLSWNSVKTLKKR